MKIINYTPHELNIIDPNTIIYAKDKRKYTFTTKELKITRTIPSSGVLLSAKIDTVELDDVDGIPQTSEIVKGKDEVPEDVDIAIVSAIYAACSNDPRIRTIKSPVFSKDFRTVVGCLAIGPKLEIGE